MVRVWNDRIPETRAENRINETELDNEDLEVKELKDKHDADKHREKSEENGARTCSGHVNGVEKTFKNLCEDRDLNGKSGEVDSNSEKGDCDTLKEKSKSLLQMIYFFQVLPFYILQFTSGMALGESNTQQNIHRKYFT